MMVLDIGLLFKHVFPAGIREWWWLAKQIVVFGIGLAIISTLSISSHAGELPRGNTESIISHLNISAISTSPGILEREFPEQSLCSMEPSTFRSPTLHIFQRGGDFYHPGTLKKYLRLSFGSGDTSQQQSKKSIDYIAGDRNAGILDKWWVAGIAMTGVVLIKYIVFKHGYSKPIPEFPALPAQVR